MCRTEVFIDENSSSLLDVNRISMEGVDSAIVIRLDSNSSNQSAICTGEVS